MDPVLLLSALLLLAFGLIGVGTAEPGLLQDHLLRVGAALLALFSNAAVLGIALYVTPGVTIDGPVSAFVGSWVYAFVMTLLTWAFSISGRDYLTVHATRMASRGARPEPSEVPGVIFVQLDGVPFPVLEWGVLAGTLPTLARWVRTGRYHMQEWTPMLPATTPANVRRTLGSSSEPNRSELSRAMGRAPIVKMSRKMPPAPVAAP